MSLYVGSSTNQHITATALRTRAELVPRNQKKPRHALLVGFDLNRHHPSTRPATVSRALRYHLRHASPSARTGSTAQVFVEPTLALTNIGVRPWAMSPRITVARSFASKAYGSLSASPSSRVGIRRRFAPSPAIFAAFCTEEWVYARTGGVRVFDYSARRGEINSFKR